MMFGEPLSDREIEILQLLADGAADKEVASQLHLSLNTVKWHNRQLYAKLGVSNRAQAVRVAEELGLLGDGPIPQKPVEKIPNNLPTPLSSFVGREKEIDEIIDLLQDHRLVTLTGPGGVGKTRLALEVAGSLLADGHFPDGVYFVELAPVTKGSRVAAVVADTLALNPPPGQPASRILIHFLKDKELLLLVDNIEHLLDSSPLIAELLIHASGLLVLATSREALQISGEQLYPVQPLESRSSMELFIQRAKQVEPRYEIIDQDLELIGQICERLDRLPLAIELAAGRINMFATEDILRKLNSRLEFLTDAYRDTPERHQTLRGAIDWSYDLLEKEEQVLFRRLAVFQGSRTIDAVQAVCCFDLDLSAVNGLESLLTKNLVRKEEGVDRLPRFYLLEMIHEYSKTKLLEYDEADEIHRRHAVFFTELAESGKYPTRGGGEQICWLTTLEAEIDNLRAAYAWSIDNEKYILGLRLVGCMDFFWLRMGSINDGVDWITEALKYVDQVPDSVKARLFSAAGEIIPFAIGDHQTGIDYLRQSLELFQQIGDTRETGWIYARLMYPKMLISEYEAVRDYYKQGLPLLVKVNDLVGIAHAQTILGLSEFSEKQFDKAQQCFEDSLATARQASDKLREGICLLNLASVSFVMGDTEGAERLFKESLKLEIEIGYSFRSGTGLLSYLAGTAIARGRFRRAVILLGATERQYENRGYRPQPHQISLFQGYLEDVRAQLQEDEFEQAWREGQAMKYEEAAAYALEE